jgi:tetratricopeptide (TPR) repeat protein
MTSGLTRLKRIHLRCENTPIVGPVFYASRLVLAHRDIRGAARHVYSRCEQTPVVGPAFFAIRLILVRGDIRGAARHLRARTAGDLAGIYSRWRPLLYLRSPRPAYWRLLTSRRKSARLAKERSSTSAERGQQGRSGYLYSYEFDTAVANYADIKSIIEHHERSKPLVSSFYRALYDLRSGIVLRMVWVMEEVLKHHVKSFGLELERFAPYQLLRSSCGDIDVRNGSIKYLQSATRHDPSLGEAHYQLGLIFRAEHRLEEALPCLQTASALPPTMLPGPHDLPLSVRTHYEAGLVLRDLKHFDESLASFEKAVALDPDFPDAQRMLVEELRRAGRYGEAGEHFHKAMFYRPVVPRLPSLPMPLAPALASKATYLYEPKIAALLLDHPVPLPPISITLHRGFRIFQLFGQTYGVPEGDGPINYPSLVARDHAVMFVHPERKKVIASIDAFLGA